MLMFIVGVSIFLAGLVIGILLCMVGIPLVIQTYEVYKMQIMNQMRSEFYEECIDDIDGEEEEARY